jgi:RNA polymerase-binding transcription factor DksA
MEMFMVMTVEVYDDAEVAAMMEQAERDAGERSIRSQVFQGTKDEALALYDAYKECGECGDILSKERQLAAPTSKYCSPCQSWFEEKQKRHKALHAV